jgi:hypothetical protein
VSNLTELATRAMVAFEDIEAIRSQLDVIGEKTNDDVALESLGLIQNNLYNAGFEAKQLALRLQSLANEEAEQQTRLIARLQASLELICDLDPNIHSSDGMNEWGEADCFTQAQTIAKASLKEREGK